MYSISQQKMSRFVIIFMSIGLCTSICSCGNNTPRETKEKTQEEIAEIFNWDDELNVENKNNVRDDAANAFDIREIQNQVEGYWDYYEQYLESKEELDEVIQNWEMDFLPAGVYEVGKDIPAGYYVFCDAEDKEEVEEENTFETYDNWEQVEKYDWGRIVFSPYFTYWFLRDGEILKITGSPKFAEISKFPENKDPKDGVYYGTIYKVGEEIMPGEYFILSMDTEKGTITSFVSNRKILAMSDPEYNQHERNRFGYYRIVEEDEYIVLRNSILFSLESKPRIFPVNHEDISFLNESKGIIETIWGDEIRDILEVEHENYKQAVYAQGEYKIGEDIPFGTYRIQSEIAWPISDLESEEYHSDKARILEEKAYSWSALYVPYDDLAEQCGWKYIRLSKWCHYNGYQSNQYIKTMQSNGDIEYTWVTEGNLPTVTFTEEDAGCVIRLTRAILIPDGEEPTY